MRRNAWHRLEDDAAPAAAGLALDEAMMAPYGRHGEPAAAAILRLYTYRPYCALVGRYQSLEDEIDLDFCRERGIEVSRRPTGGGAIIMGPGQLGVALATRASAERTPRELLQHFARGVVAGLARLGIDARFRSKNDLEVAARKIAGLGLYLDPQGAVLFHASVLVDLDVPLMLEVLRIPGAKLSDKAVAQVSERVTTVSRQLGREVESSEVRAALGAGFEETFGVETRELALGTELCRRRDELVAERYGNEAWIRQRSPRRDAGGSSLVKTPAGLLRIYVGVHGEAIKSVLVSGDFNVLPAGVGRLEAALKWCRAEPARIARLTGEHLAAEDLGMPPAEVAGAIWEAAERALQRQREAEPERLAGSCYFPEPAAGDAAAGAALRKGAAR